MPVEPMGRPRRVEWRLPLAIAALLVLVVAVLTATAYREVRAAAFRSAEVRVTEVAAQLAELLSASVDGLVSQAGTAAGDVVLADALRSSSSSSPERLQALLESQLASSSQVRAVELWDTAGTLVADVRRDAEGGSDAPAAAFPDWAVGDSAAVSGFHPVDGEIRYAVAARITDGGQVLGYLVPHRALSDSPDDVNQIERLIGSGATFKVGVPGGSWTDLAAVVEGPPEGLDDDGLPTTYEAPEGRDVLGAGAPVEGAPWLAWVEFPLDVVLERPRAFLARMIPLGFVMVLVGAVGGGVLSRRLVAALQDSEEQFRALASTAPDAIVTADGEGCVTFFNPGAESVFGRSEEEMIGRPLTELMPPRFREPHRKALQRWVDDEDASELERSMEVAGLRADGTEFPIELSLAGRRHGERPVFTGIIRDITERTRRDEAIRRYASELEATNRELEAFSYSVSHDLRAPLRAIHGFSQAVLEDYQDRLDETGEDYLRRVCAASERMDVLIDDLLELSRASRDEMRLEQVDLSAAADDAAEKLAAAEPDRSVDVRIGRGLTARADRKLMALVLDNLMGNAWKFTSGTDAAVIEFDAAEEEGTFFVRDNGAGFDMTYADKLFDPFQRLHTVDEFEGTGIGLALVQRIVRRHGGTVWGEAVVGEGATFYFSLPES